VTLEDARAEQGRAAGGGAAGGATRMSLAPGKRSSVYMGAGAGAGAGDVAALRREAAAREQRCVDLERARERLERQAEQHKLELAALREEAGSAKKELRAKGVRASNLERNKEELERDLDKCKARLATAEERGRVLAQEKAALAGEKGTAEREGRVLAGKVEAHEKELERLRGVAAKVKEATTAAAVADKRAAAAGTERDAAVAEQQTARAALEAAGAEVQGLTEERDRLLTQHTQLATTNAATLVELQDLQAQQAELERICEDMSARIKALEEGKAAAEAEAAELRAARDALAKDLARESEKAAAQEKALAAQQGSAQVLQAPPPPRTKWTRRVPHPVLSEHAASLTPY